MSVFKIENSVSSLNEEVLRDYADVYFHCENAAIVEGHMAIIAPLSPFCHKFFKTRKNTMFVDMFFPQIRHSVIQSAIMIMYGREVHVPVFWFCTPFLANLVCFVFKFPQTKDSENLSTISKKIVNPERRFVLPENTKHDGISCLQSPTW